MDDDEALWDEAFATLMSCEDIRPLAYLLGSTRPIPQRIRSHLRSLMIGDDPAFSDRIFFSRAQSTRRKIKTNKETIEIGVKVMKMRLESVETPKTVRVVNKIKKNTFDDAVDKVHKKTRLSQSKVEKSVGLAQRLPAKYRPIEAAPARDETSPEAEKLDRFAALYYGAWSHEEIAHKLRMPVDDVLRTIEKRVAKGVLRPRDAVTNKFR